MAGSLLGEPVCSILVFKQRNIGDVLLATPAIHALRSAWPKARLAVAVNSGTEAIEAALKLGRKARPGRSRVVVCNGAFHGRTFGALSATMQENYQAPFRPLLAGFVVLMMLMVTVIYNDLTRISWIERLMPWRN